jgi:hypothetical protein
MSRTFRKIPVNVFRWFFGKCDNYDGKPGYKPPSWWKRLRRAKERAKEKLQLMRGIEPKPAKKHDIWDWN